MLFNQEVFSIAFRNMNTSPLAGRIRSKQKGTVHSTQTVASGAKMLRFPQTSWSSNWAISELLSSRSRLDSSAVISSAAASRSAGLQEGTRFRCASMSSRVVNAPFLLSK